MWIFFALGSALSAALVAVTAKLGLKGVDSNTLTALRSVVMSVLLLLFVFGTGAVSGMHLGRVSGRDWMYIVLSGFFGALSWLLYFYALKYGNTVAVVALDKLSVAFVLILSVFLLRETTTVYTVAGVVLITFGTLLTLIK